MVENWTSPITDEDPHAGFECGKRELDDFFARHALRNHQLGVGRTYVARRSTEDFSLPAILGFYTLSMAIEDSNRVAGVVEAKLPRYPMPVALLGRLAVDRRAQGHRFGEHLLIDSMRRVVRAAGELGCLGMVVDAKEAQAERFYDRYGFVVIEDSHWPRRMFLPMATLRDALS